MEIGINSNSYPVGAPFSAPDLSQEETSRKFKELFVLTLAANIFLAFFPFFFSQNDNARTQAFGLSVFWCMFRFHTEMSW